MKNKLGSDQVYLYPTDTVWGMGANIFSEKGHERIFALKGSRENKPFSIMFSNISQVTEYFSLPNTWDLSEFEKILKLECTLGFLKSWAKVSIPAWVTSDSPYIAFRCIDTPEVKYIIEKEKSPITTTSLNKSNEPPTKNLEEAKKFLEGAPQFCELVNISKVELSGNPSTIVFFEDEKTFKIHRMGAKGLEIESRLRLLTA